VVETAQGGSEDVLDRGMDRNPKEESLVPPDNLTLVSVKKKRLLKGCAHRRKG